MPMAESMSRRGHHMEQGHVEDGKCVFFLEGRITLENVKPLERELQDLLEAHPDQDLVLDALRLDYISSKGLRTLLKLIRKSAGKLTIRNATETTYSVLETAGVTDLAHVEAPFGSMSSDTAARRPKARRRTRPPRRITTDGSQVIGMGRSSVVYLLDSETLVKKYDEHVPIERIHQEMDRARCALVHGIPTAMPLALVRADDSYGIVFERIAPADTVGHTITEHAERFNEITRKHTELLRQIHRTPVGEEARFPAQKDVWLNWVEGMRPHYRAAEIDFLREMVEGIPDRSTMVHCDFHENNVLVTGDDLVLLDMVDVGYGHPVFDLAGGAFRAHVSMIPGRHAHHGLSPNDMQRFWEDVVSRYFGTSDPGELEEILDMCLAFGLVRSALFPMKHVHIGDDLRRIHIDDARQNLFSRQDWAFRQLEKLGRLFPNESGRA